MLHDINTIDVRGATLSLYADDLAIWKTIPGNIRCKRMRDRNMAAFQATADGVTSYMRESGFTLSAEKTVFVFFTKIILNLSLNKTFSIQVNNHTIHPSNDNVNNM